MSTTRSQDNGGRPPGTSANREGNVPSMNQKEPGRVINPAGSQPPKRGAKRAASRAASRADKPILDQATIRWMSQGGVSACGVRYGPLRKASAWGTPGCPILNLEAREQMDGQDLPDSLKQTFGPRIELHNLDGRALKQHLKELPREQQAQVRALMERMKPDGSWTAVPAGIPIDWVLELPLSGRTRNALKKIFQEFEPGTSLNTPLSAPQLLEQRGVRMLILNELMCVLESTQEHLEDRRPASRSSQTPPAGNLEEQLGLLVGAGRAAANALVEFARSDPDEDGPTTLGGKIIQALRHPDAPGGWPELAAIPLEQIASRPDHAYEIIDTWAEGLKHKEQKILHLRLNAFPPTMTLAEIAREFKLTRERIRQIEHLVWNRLETLSRNQPEITRLVEEIREILGAAAPRERVAGLLEAPENVRDYRAAMLEIAGPYELEKDGWLVRTSTRTQDPAGDIVASPDAHGCLKMVQAHHRLNQWGLDPGLHHAWLLRSPQIRESDGQLFVRAKNIPDRLLQSLRRIGKPASVDRLMEHAGEQTSRPSVINAMGTDPRMHRVNAWEWGDAEWELPEYHSTTHAIRGIIEQDGGESNIPRIIEQMKENFKTPAGTTRAYLRMPVFTRKGNSIRLRTPEDGPFQHWMQRQKADLIHRAAGIFDLGESRLGRLITVKERMLQGSGTSLPKAAGAILQVEVNRRLAFTNGKGNIVQVTFPETMAQGPRLGSVRSILKHLDARPGDLLTLVLKREDLSAKGVLTQEEELRHDWETVGRLTGLGAMANPDTLADALHCTPGEMEDVLRKRRDDQLLRYLPKAAGNPQAG